MAVHGVGAVGKNFVASIMIQRPVISSQRPKTSMEHVVLLKQDIRMKTIVLLAVVVTVLLDDM